MLLNFLIPPLHEQAERILAETDQGFLDDLDRYEFGENTVTTRFFGHLDEKEKKTDPLGVRMELLGTRWEIPPHTDMGFPRWCYFLVLINPGFELNSIANYRFSPMIYQGQGAVLGLDLHRLHWLWVALTFASSRQLSGKIVERRFRAAADELTGHLETKVNRKMGQLGEALKELKLSEK